MGVLFVAAVGFGALPGVLALAIHSVGMVGNVSAEPIQHVDGTLIEAARAADCGPFVTIMHAVLPQVAPQGLRLYGVGLTGSAVAIIGDGAVGRPVAARRFPFGCAIRAYDPSGDCRGADTALFEAVLTTSDIVMLAPPLVASTSD